MLNAAAIKNGVCPHSGCSSALPILEDNVHGTWKYCVLMLVRQYQGGWLLA